MKKKLLAVRDLHTEYRTDRGTVQAVRGVDLTLHQGEILGLVGESGSGKSVTCMSILKLLKRGGHIVSGSVKFDDRDLLQLSERQLTHIRGDRIGVVFQDPMSALNPTMTVGRQITEVLLRHQPLTKAARGHVLLNCSNWFVSPLAPHGLIVIRMSFRAACVNV